MSVEPTASAPARAEGLAPPEDPAPAPDGRRPATRRSSRSSPASRASPGLVREIVASSYFATSGAFSAFTIAFQVPNVVRSLFADAALSAAFVPVFTELLEHGQAQGGLQARLDALLPDPHRAERHHGALHPLRRRDHAAVRRGRAVAVHDLTVGLSRVLFPVVVMLGPQRPRGRDPERLRPLHDPGAQPAGVERGHPPLPRWVAAGAHRRRPALRLRDRRPRGHDRPVRDGPADAAQARLPPRRSPSPSAIRACARSCCSCCR